MKGTIAEVMIDHNNWHTIFALDLNKVIMKPCLKGNFVSVLACWALYCVVHGK